MVMFFLGAIALISSRGYFFDNVSSSPVTVIINDEGFSPEKLTVFKGTTITWVNEGERLHWPASNFHPTHTLYPEKGGCIGSLLDACRGLQRGETYSFKLNKLGTWPMHDHLSPGLVMIVKVINKENSDSEKISVYNEKMKVEDFRIFDYGKQLDFIKSMSQESPAKAWSYVKEAFMINNQVVGNVHEFAHIIGNESYWKSGLEGIKICDTTFAFGCFHGVTEAMLLKEGVQEVKAIEIGCLELFPPNLSEDYTGCIHGTGHGIYTWEGGDYRQALLDCDIISESYRQYCYDGVFMENASLVGSRVFDEKNPWKFCTDLDERYHHNCARYQSQIFFSELNGANSFSLVGKNCALGPSVLLRETCFQSLGFHVAQSSLGKLEDIFKNCKRMPSTEGREMCIVGAAQENIFQEYVGFEDSSNKLCLSLAESGQSKCFANVNRMIKRRPGDIASKGLTPLFANSEDFFSKFRSGSISDPVKIMANKIKKYCLENASLSKGKENCYAEEFKKIGEKNGPEFSFKVLDNLQKIDPDAVGCHLIAHGIGWGSYKREPDNWRTLVQNMDSSCNYGAIHGVLESYINSLPDKSLKRDVIPSVCGENPRADCNHILGHLLLVQTDADVDKALDLCSVFTGQQNSFCISGVFMEYQTALNLVAHDLVPKSWLDWPPRLGELEKLCRSYSGKEAEGCWEEIVHIALAKFNNDPKQTWDLCNTAQVPNGAKRCVRHSIGIIGASRNFDLPSLKSICAIPQKNNFNFEGECYTDLISSALSTIPTMVPEAVSFCNNLEDQFRQSCFSMIGAVSFSLPVVKDQLPKACKATTPDLQNYCLGVSSTLNQPYIKSSND